MFIHKKAKSNQSRYVCECFIFDSIRDMAVDSEKATYAHKDPYQPHDFDRLHFYGREIRDLEHAVKISTEPWDDGLKIIQEMIDELRDSKLPMLTSKKRRSVWRMDDGDDVDMDRLRSGQEFWRKSQREKTPGSGTITIISDMRAACIVNANNILWRGAASIVLTYLLEQAGYRVELWAGQAGAQAYTDHSEMMVAARIKTHQEPLNLGTAVASVSSWFYRSVGFHAANLCQEKNPTAFAAMDRPNGMVPFIPLLSKDETSFVVQGIWDKEAALNFVRNASKAIEEGDVTNCKWAYSWEHCLNQSYSLKDIQDVVRINPLAN